MEVYKYVKGGIWWCDFPEDQPRGLMQGRHMAIIISGVANPSSTCTLTVLPISSMNSSKDSETKLRSFFCIPITVYKDCFVCCNQPTTITTSQLHDYVGQVNGSKLQIIEEELMRYFQFYVKPDYNKSPKELSSNYLQNSIAKSEDNEVIIDDNDIENSDETIGSVPIVKKIKRPRRKVLVVETGEVFPSIRSCYLHFDVPRSDVERALKKNGFIYSTFGNFQLRYAEL